MAETRLETAVRKFLYSSEEAKIVLETLVTSSDSVGSPGNLDDQDKRVLAVITHRDRLDGHEEGRYNYYDLATELGVQHIFPIVDDFSITMAQVSRGSVDTRTSLLDMPRSGLTLTINPGEGLSRQPITLLTTDAHHLRSVLEECKRLKEVFDITASLTSRRTHAWLIPYVAKQNPFLRFSSSVPPDLRTACRPLHTHLSHASAGLPGDSVADIQLIRDEWVQTRAHRLCRSGSETVTTTFRIRLGTFNVNGKMPSQDLSTWLNGNFRSATSSKIKEAIQANINSADADIDFPSDTQTATPNSSSLPTASSSETINSGRPSPSVDADDGPDIIVLAFQELDLSTDALLYSTSTAREDAWCMAAFAGLGERAILYTKLASRQLVGMLLVVIAKTSLKQCFQDLETCTVGTGIMGVLGNKGGIALRVKISPLPTPDVPSPLSTTFTFVNSHLAAFDGMVDRRNADFHDLSRRLVFPLKPSIDNYSVQASVATLSVFECDALFWIGDFNYRVDLPDTDVRTILASEHWARKFETLLRYDQLNNAMNTRKAFGMFYEHPIAFPPTYRFGTGLKDELGYDLKRRPAWTDRILHMSGPHTDVQQLSYSSHPEISMSDHRPASADFTIKINAINKITYDMTLYKLYQQVAGLEESEERPIVKLDPATIELGQVSYKRPLTRTFSLQNLGKIPCAFHFVPLELDTPVHPKWFKVEPMAGLFLPDETVVITLTVYIDNESASHLNLVSKQIASTLILHIARGKDHFIPITGQYEFTCFGNKLSDLTRLDRPIRAIDTSDDLLPANRAMNAPREIMRLVNWLMENTSNVDGLFVLPAEVELVDTIRECLDTGIDFPFNNPPEHRVVLAFGDTLLQFLDSLTEPVVPHYLHVKCSQVNSRSEAFELLDTFPSISVNVWISLTAFLSCVILPPDVTDSNSNKIEHIASIFAPILLRDDSTSTYPPASLLGKYSFLIYFIS